jgi:hypothetical protein
MREMGEKKYRISCTLPIFWILLVISMRQELGIPNFLALFFTTEIPLSEK